MSTFEKGKKVRAIRDTKSFGAGDLIQKGAVLEVSLTSENSNASLFNAWRPDRVGHYALAKDDFEPADAIPAPIDPSKAAITLKAGDYIEAESDGAKIGGKVSHVNENGFVAIEHLGTFAIHHITPSPLPNGYRMFVLTAHQPAPEPEYVDTLSAVIFEEIGKSPDDHALAADLAAAAVRERFVAIDLAGLRERLADVARAKFGGPTDAWFDFADAALAELGLETTS